MAQDDTKEEQDYKLQLAHKRFLFRTQDVADVDRSRLQREVLDLVQQHEMAPVYEEVCTELGAAPDANRLAQMRERNAARLAELEEKITDAEANAGEMEVRDALQAKAEFLCGVGDHAAAMEAFKAAEAKTAGVGPKMDLLFSQIRLELSRGDLPAVKDQLEQAKVLCGKGGDWERKNKLKVYEAVFLMATRQFKRAAELLLDAIATFTSGELMPYERCIFYTVVLAVVALDRPTLKSKVIDSPEVLSVIDSLPDLRPFVTSLYDCRYAAFFQAFAGLTDAIRADEYLHPHFRFYMREVRAVAYAQFLESYKSVTLASMAATFGVSPDFLDAELADFIVAGRLPAKIDKVAGVVETNRPDAKTALYQAAIKQGDLLLNRVQKLSKVVDIE
ncbi:26S proteasome non-ATPase regulatory subunit 6-like protein [Chlorella sorokiniana]|uniref:26S proteasome regulatory subunit RPN7 n=1 Tax=Chlorella sorokiniana TaxID=3076 RepID=A0A2P6U335_CHLSO|nr:26S proteasome non-ATPase regulatory subunit 6-like protein [Chlorella sorokiniana]|eukprot:PRW60726.1 26S proteasome non-ATPase regulatory subunit 6-like protein [Chlorella sorokiniana]